MIGYLWRLHDGRIRTSRPAAPAPPVRMTRPQGAPGWAPPRPRRAYRKLAILCEPRVDPRRRAAIPNWEPLVCPSSTQAAFRERALVTVIPVRLASPTFDDVAQRVLQLDREAAIHHKSMAGDEGRLVGSQKQRRPSTIDGPARPSNGMRSPQRAGWPPGVPPPTPVKRSQ